MVWLGLGVSQPRPIMECKKPQDSSVEANQVFCDFLVFSISVFCVLTYIYIYTHMWHFALIFLTGVAEFFSVGRSLQVNEIN